MKKENYELITDLNSIARRLKPVLEREDQLKKDFIHLIDVMETMIPLTVCDTGLKKQWERLIVSFRSKLK